MNEVHVLVNYEHGCEVLGAFTDKALLEEYVACPCEDECEYCESLGARGNKGHYHELDFWTVALDDPSFIQLPKHSPENTNMRLSNGYGEILGAFTEKALLEQYVATFTLAHHCRYCERYESRGEVCPYRQSFIDTVPLDNPSLIQHCKERIAKILAEIRESNNPVEHQPLKQNLETQER